MRRTCTQIINITKTAIAFVGKALGVNEAVEIAKTSVTFTGTAITFGALFERLWRAMDEKASALTRPMVRLFETFKIGK